MDFQCVWVCGDASIAIWPIESFVRGVAELRKQVGVVEETAREIHVDE